MKGEKEKVRQLGICVLAFILAPQGVSATCICKFTGSFYDTAHDEVIWPVLFLVGD